jgi:hypothetical protein
LYNLPESRRSVKSRASDAENDDRLKQPDTPAGAAVPIDEAGSSGKGPTNTTLHRLAEAMGIKL